MGLAKDSFFASKFCLLKLQMVGFAARISLGLEGRHGLGVVRAVGEREERMVSIGGQKWRFQKWWIMVEKSAVEEEEGIGYIRVGSLGGLDLLV